MAEDSDLEKTEDATPRRIERAREQGQVPHSRELSTFVVLITGLLAVVFMAESLYEGMRLLMSSNLTFSVADLKTPDQQIHRLYQAAADALFLFLPFLLAVVVVAIVANGLMSGWLISTEALAPKFERLNPLSGMKRVISVQGLVEMGKALLKATLTGGIAVWIMWNDRAEMLGLISEPLESAIAHTGHLVQDTLLWVVGSLLALVVIDVPWQLYSYYKSLRMTKEEVKQEMKEAEGDPQIKARIRQLQRDAARRRMMQNVPKADVIVTNPTHYAVAIRYDQATMRAPVVVAKGAFRMAEQIIAKAEEHRITILRAPPFARALYFHAPLDKEIPVALFQATAEVLAYLYQLRLYQSSGGTRPPEPSALPVPPELDPGEKAEDIPELDDLNPRAR